MFGNKKIYNIYLFTPIGTHPSKQISRDSIFLKVSEICRYCDEGRDKIQQINNWKFNRGFKHKLQLRESFKNNFYGAELSMAFAFWDTDINKPNDFMVLADVLNFTWRIVPAVNEWSWEQTFTEQLGNGSVDVMGGGWYMIYERLLKVGGMCMSTPETYFGGYPIVSIEPEKNIKVDSFISAFDSYLWFCLFTMIPVCGITLYVCRKYGSNSEGRVDFCNCLWEISVILG